MAMLHEKSVVHWFRQDLRLKDNQAFFEAAHSGKVLPLYIVEEQQEPALGAASRAWLARSLKALSASLEGNLSFYVGDAQSVLDQLVDRYQIEEVFWTRRYDPWGRGCDAQAEAFLKKKGVKVRICNGSLLWEPRDVCKKDGSPYRVFTPFYQKGCLSAPSPLEPLPAPSSLNFLQDKHSLSLKKLGLSSGQAWEQKVMTQWDVGEEGAQKRLRHFVEQGLKTYKKGRDFPSQESVSRLSPYLHFGEVSPRQLWAKSFKQEALRPEVSVQTEAFRRELAWREFSYSLLYTFPALPQKSWNSKFSKFPWRKDEAALRAWQQGKTGIPIVDAGMRELWQTGYMHNRVRMVVASFLVKNLLLPWQEGAQWFWDTLVDADLANNSASWQWVAGCGADAAPYFRIFNPVLQGQKFDAQGEYTRRFVPELDRLPLRFLFCPWEAPAQTLQDAGVVLGKTYPQPIVDLKASRLRALEMLTTL